MDGLISAPLSAHSRKQRQIAAHAIVEDKAKANQLHGLNPSDAGITCGQEAETRDGN
jgi:hypothetical protein